MLALDASLRKVLPTLLREVSLSSKAENMVPGCAQAPKLHASPVLGTLYTLNADVTIGHISDRSATPRLPCCSGRNAWQKAETLSSAHASHLLRCPRSGVHTR